MWTPNNTLTLSLPFKPLGSLVRWRSQHKDPFFTYFDPQAVNNYNSLESNLAWQPAWLASPGTNGVMAYPTDYTLIWNDKVRLRCSVFRT